MSEEKVYCGIKRHVKLGRDRNGALDKETKWHSLVGRCAKLMVIFFHFIVRPTRYGPRSFVERLVSTCLLLRLAGLIGGQGFV